MKKCYDIHYYVTNLYLEVVLVKESRMNYFQLDDKAVSIK
jgi:hypothetical protein